MLIFLHLGKTGGSTLKPIVDWNYNDNVKMLSTFDELNHFLEHASDSINDYDCLFGMMFYRVHQQLKLADYEYLTMMRHPYERLISQYYYLNIRKERLGEALVEMSIREFLDYEPFQASVQLNMIAGSDASNTTIDDIIHRQPTPRTVEQAIDNIEAHFPIVGDFAKYDESLLLMKQRYDWSRAYYVRSNTNTGHKRYTDFSAEEQAAIADACALELELYQYVQARLQNQLDQQSPAFWDALQHLRRRNQQFAQLHRILAPIRHSKLWFQLRSLAKRILP